MFPYIIFILDILPNKEAVLESEPSKTHFLLHIQHIVRKGYQYTWRQLYLAIVSLNTKWGIILSYTDVRW